MCVGQSVIICPEDLENEVSKCSQTIPSCWGRLQPRMGFFRFVQKKIFELTFVSANKKFNSFTASGWTVYFYNFIYGLCFYVSTQCEHKRQFQSTSWMYVRSKTKVNNYLKQDFRIGLFKLNARLKDVGQMRDFVLFTVSVISR